MKNKIFAGWQSKFKSLFKFVLSKRFWNATLCICVILFLLVTPKFVFDKKNYEVNVDNLLNEGRANQVINLWHVETFEGGSASRTRYIESQAVNFNKKNPGCFFSIRTMTEEQLFYNLEQGLKADIYSFGIGAGYMLKSNLQTLSDNKSIRRDLIDCGKISKTICAYPYILSGYALISHKSDWGKDKEISEKLQENDNLNKNVQSFGFGVEGFINPSRVLVKNSVSNLNLRDFFAGSTTYNAYTNFLSGKFLSLIGTARDVARCKNREQNGSLSACSYDFLPGYSDLVQYIGIDKNVNTKTRDYCLEFLNFLIQSDAQSALSKYGLFSVNGKSIYENGYMRDFESALSKHLTSTNVFLNPEQIEEQKKSYFDKLFLAP